MDINTALKLIDLGYTTEQIRNLETPGVETTAPTSIPVETAVVAPVETPVPEPVPEKQATIDYKKLAEEVALYNQRNNTVQPEAPVVKTPDPVPPKTASEVLLNFLG